jgi:predicted PurR-regulated permease PerM
MENEQNKEVQQSVPTKNKWFAGYLIAGLIWKFAQSFKKNTMDEFIILVIAITAGVLYHRLKSKIKVKNEAGKIAITFIILYIVSALLIGFLTSLANNWEAVAVRTPLGTEIATRDRDSLTQLNQNQKTFLADFQVRWDKAQNDVDDKTDSKAGYVKNVAAYKNLQSLNDERQDQVVQYFNQASPILVKYSQKLVDAFSQLIKSDEKARVVYNEIFVAKINYYQALIDNRSDSEISAKAKIVNDAVDKVDAVVQEGAQDQQNYQKVYTDFFGS